MKEETVVEKDIIVEDNVVKIEQDIEETEVETTEQVESTEVETTQVVEPAYTDAFKSKIEGKTETEIKQMLFDSEQFSGRLGTEVGQLRTFKKETEAPKTSKDIKARVEKTDGKIAMLDAEISKLDADLDDDEIADLVAKKNHLLDKKGEYNDQHLQMFIQETVDKQGAGEHNKRLSGEVREKFATNYNKKFSDEEWEVISGYAKDVSKEFRTEPEDYEFAMMKGLGLDVYRTLGKAKAEVTVRNDIEKASEQVVATVGGKTKSSYLEIDMENMSNYQIGKQLDKLSDPELKKLKERINRK